MPSNRTIEGIVVNTSQGYGVGNLRVETWCRLQQKIPRRGFTYELTKVGEDKTAESGKFSINISSELLLRLSGTKIWFKVIAPVGQILADTWDSINWSTDNPREVKIAVDWDTSHGGMVPARELSLQGEDGSVRVHLDGNSGSGRLGGNAADGILALFSKDVTDINQIKLAAVRLDAQDGGVRLGGNNTDGKLSLNNGAGICRIYLNASDASGTFGGHGMDGQVNVYPATAMDNTDPGQATIRLDGKTGDICLANADCAEDFDISSRERDTISPGHVMVLDHEAHLSLCRQPYDNRVAGIISGAGDYRPGIVLDKQAPRDHRLPLALVGKVFCWANAEYGSIGIGDLLTTSPTPGHAMKVMDRGKAFGAVIGKALQPLDAGKGLIPILVALQ